MKKIFAAIFIIGLLTIITGCATTTPLMQAAGRGDVSTLKDLIDKGADINEKGGLGSKSPSIPLWERRT
jgi:hypothetical protein